MARSGEVRYGRVGDLRVALFFLPFRSSSVLLHPSPSLPREGGLVLADRGLPSRVKRPGQATSWQGMERGRLWRAVSLYYRNAVFTPCSKVDFTVIEDL